MTLTNSIQKTYHNIKEQIPSTNTIKKYATRTALTTTLSIGLTYNTIGQKINNNTKQEIKNEQQTEQTTRLKQLKTTYQTTIDRATILFNEAIKDRKLTIKEQKEILKKYNQAKIKLNYYNNFAKENNLETITMNYKYFKLIEKNIEGWDWGTPELEKQLKKDGLNINVKNYLSDDKEELVGGLILSIIVASLGAKLIE